MWEEQQPVVRITTFGPFLVEWLNSEQRYTPISADKIDAKGVLPARSLLKLLLCQPHRYAPRDWVLEQFWPDMEHKAALHRVGNVIWILRRLLCPPDARDQDSLRSLLLTSTQSDQGTGLGYQLAAYPLIWVDADAFESCVEQAARLSRFGDDPLPLWQRAYELASRGTFLADEIYSEWATQRRHLLDGHFRQCVFELSRLLIARGLTTEAEVCLRKYVVAHPTDEDVLRPLMELLGEQERYQELLSYYETCLTVLADEDRQPDARTQDIAEYFKSKPIRRVRTTEKRPSMDLPRRNFLYLLGMEGIGARSLISQPLHFTPTKPSLRISETSISSLLAITNHFRILQRQGNIPISQELTAHLSVIQNALDTTMNERQRQDLWKILAQAQLICRLSLHPFAKQDLAKIINEEAIASAQNSKDTALIGAAIGHLAHFYLRRPEKDPLQASQLLKQAREYSKGQKALLGWFTLLDASIASLQGKKQECEKLLHLSLEAAYQSKEVIDPYFTDFSVTSVQVFGGNSLLTVGEPEKASQWLTEAELEDLSYHRHASVYYDLARVYAASGELGSMQEYALKSMDCAWETNNLYIIPRIFSLAHTVQQNYPGNSHASTIIEYALERLQ